MKTNGTNATNVLGPARPSGSPGHHDAALLPSPFSCQLNVIIQMLADFLPGIKFQAKVCFHVRHIPNQAVLAGLRAKIVTRWPCLTSSRATCEPMKPVPFRPLGKCSRCYVPLKIGMISPRVSFALLFCDERQINSRCFKIANNSKIIHPAPSRSRTGYYYFSIRLNDHA
jgi:hypothetical protein